MFLKCFFGFHKYKLIHNGLVKFQKGNQQLKFKLDGHVYECQHCKDQIFKSIQEVRGEGKGYKKSFCK